MSYAATAEAYARAVVDGKVLACKWVRLACTRHLEDLGRSKRSDFRYRFDEESANHVCQFIELLPHTKGRWAVERKGKSNRIRLEPWQIFVLSVAFGWVRKERSEDGRLLRRFRVVYIEVPRKNGKSILAAGVALYLFAADGEFGAEVYCGATSKAQAWEVFRPAKVMVERTEELRDSFGIDAHASNLHILEDNSRLEPVIGKPGDGASPSGSIIDEFHEHDSDELYDTMLTGMGAREQPMQFVITTAGENLEGPCYALHDDVQKMLEGTLENDELFGAVWTVDDGDDWTSEESLRKANPNYGISVGAEYLQSQVADAVRSSRKQGIVKTKHLNIWVRARNAWMNMESWKRQGDAPPLEEFEGEACWVGIDLSSKIDIAGVVKCFRRDLADGMHYYLFGRYYLPEERTLDPKARHYQKWARDGKLILTEGSIIDSRRIEEDLVEDSGRFVIEQLGYDPYGATDLAVRLQDDHGFNVLEIPQTVAHLSEPMKWLEAFVLGGKLHHDGDPVLTWMFSNVVARVDARDNIFPRKGTERENKIDGVLASIMALARAMAGEDDGSAYSEERGILVI